MADAMDIYQSAWIPWNVRLSLLRESKVKTHQNEFQNRYSYNRSDFVDGIFGVLTRWHLLYCTIRPTVWIWRKNLFKQLWIGESPAKKYKTNSNKRCMPLKSEATEPLARWSWCSITEVPSSYYASCFTISDWIFNFFRKSIY